LIKLEQSSQNYPFKRKILFIEKAMTNQLTFEAMEGVSANIEIWTKI
jgi:hypothetical protein